MSYRPTPADARWAKSIGVSLEDEPMPSVPGELYARLVTHNEVLVSENAKLVQERDFLRVSVSRLQQRREERERRVPLTWTGMAFVFIAAVGAAGWILWWYKP